MAYTWHSEPGDVIKVPAAVDRVASLTLAIRLGKAEGNCTTGQLERCHSCIVDYIFYIISRVTSADSACRLLRWLTDSSRLIIWLLFV